MTPIHGKQIVETGNEQSHFEDEVLETVWETLEQCDSVEYRNLVRELGHKDRLLVMEQNGFITVSDGFVELTPAGTERARDIIRRHRLAERLFADVLDLQDYEEDACRLEHALSPGVSDAICTLLGHPPVCPHGKEIPRGKCCTLYANRVTPLAQSLKDLEVGKEARILFMHTPAVGRLATMGLIPGALVKLGQKRPSYVIEIDETTVALDEELAKGIYVKRI